MIRVIRVICEICGLNKKDIVTMSKELTNSTIERQNVLNNPFAVRTIQGKLKKEKNPGTQVQLNTRIK